MALAFETEHTEGLSRLGTLKTPHGDVQTPALMPVVNPNLELIDPSQLRGRFGVQMLITNAYIIHRGDAIRDTALNKGVHALLDYDGPLMTDSGTFQDYVYGEVDLDPADIVDFQQRIGTDIGTILDVFSTPDRTHDEAKHDADETLVRAMDTIPHAQEMGLALPVQGATYPDLREQAARDMARLTPPGGAIHPIGGVVPLMENQRYETLARVILGAQRGLHTGRPVHLFGAGHPQMLPLAVYLGCDLFDSAAYAKFAQDDRLLFPWGTEHLDDLDELPCTCPTCQDTTPRELIDLDAQARKQNLAEHNLHTTIEAMRRIRQAQRQGRLFDLVLERATTHPALAETLPVLEDHVEHLEQHEPLSRKRATHLLPHAAAAHPQRARTHDRIQRRIQPEDPLTLLEETTRPYTANTHDTVQQLRNAGIYPLFPSRFGPVPYAIDEAYPFAQSLEPPLTDTDLDEQHDRFHKLAEAWNLDTLPLDEALKQPQTQTIDLLTERVHHTAAYQFGPQAARYLLEGDLTFETSPRTGRIRTIHADDEHILSRRPYDGLYTLKLAGAQRLHQWMPRPYRRLRVTHDSARFNADAKSVFAKFLQGIPDALRPGDECLIVDPEDTLVACARLHVTPREARDLTSGPVASVREGIGQAAYEATLEADA